ncbi:MAG: tetratricopeptide repeat protein [Myxococcales bacterium]|nr:tetratricopeptide repeat protein [Myxococcales bacterium]
MSRREISEACRRSAEIHRAFSEGSRASVAAHLRDCARCEEEWAALAALAAQARSLPVMRLDAGTKADIRGKLLLAARREEPSKRPTSRRRLRAFFVAALALAGAVAAVMFDLPPEAEVATARQGSLFLRRGTIRGHHDAVFAAISSQPDEVVVLYQGTVSVEVSPLHPGERFRIVTDDAQIEVVGTEFDVTVDEGKLLGVVVDEGLVEVRGRGGALVSLPAGSDWEAPPAAPAEPSADEAIPAPAPPASAAPSAPPSAPPPVGPSADELAFRRGWDALRRDDPEAAVRAFEGVVRDAPLAPDAAFWRGVALARAGRRAEAIFALEQFVRIHPASPHASEARALLARLSP